MSARKILLAGGVASSVLYIAAIDVLAPLVHPEYHSYRYKMVSELFASGSPTRGLLLAPMFVYNLLVFALAAGVWISANRSRSAGQRRATRLTAVAVAMYGAISTAGGFLTPMDVRGSGGPTERDVIHIAATAVQGVAMVVALAAGAFAHGARFRLYSLVTLAVALVAGAISGIVAAAESSPWLGTSERVSVYAWMLWIAALAVAFWRLPARRGAASRTALVGKAETTSAAVTGTRS